MRVRAANASDGAQVAELLTELGYPVTAAEAGERVARGEETVLVAEQRGRLLGLLAIWSQLPIAHARPTARVTALVVRSEAQGRGVGRRLMEQAVRWAREAGCEGIELTSGLRAERERAHAFYEAFGFRRTSLRFWLEL